MSNFILAAAAQIEPNRLIMLPFAVLLLSIAFLPVVLKRHWERYYHLVALFLAATTTDTISSGFGIRNASCTKAVITFISCNSTRAILHTKFYWVCDKVFSSHPLAGAFAGLLANDARLKVDRCSPV
jgi:hypothetical protein